MFPFGAGNQIAKITGHVLNVHDPDFRLSAMLDANLVGQIKLLEIAEKWANEEFRFFEWKGRGLQILQGTTVTIEQLEEDQMNLQTMLTMRHVTPFKPQAVELLKTLSDTSETLELWLKVQMLWCSLESVFLGGDIARQMPVVAKKFVKIDKDWVKIMAKVLCCRGGVFFAARFGLCGKC